MSSLCRSAVLLLLATACAPMPKRILRVCADPENLPFSNSRGEGFENRIAGILAREMSATVTYTWWAQRRGFVRNTLAASTCDVIAGVPASFDLALTTRPYYRSSYMFVWRRDRPAGVTSFDDPALRRLRIGVQLVGDDFANTPPAHALSSRGIVDNVRGFPILADSSGRSASGILQAVLDGTIDIAVVWGPAAGYFAAHSRDPLELRPVSPEIDLPFLPFVFDIAMAVRRSDTLLRNELDRALVARRAEIDSVLSGFGVPRVERQAAVVGARP